MGGADTLATLDAAALEALVAGRSGDPFALLGPHGAEVRSFQPGAQSVAGVAAGDGAELGRLERVHPAGLFAGRVARPGAITGEVRIGGFGGADGLADWLREHEVTHVDVCGIATDYCVRQTALDAVANGFETKVLTRLSAGISPATTKAALEAMRDAGVTVG
jgi:nicotinamidase-related amidase